MARPFRIPRRWQIRLAGGVLLILALCNLRLIPCAMVLLLALLPVLASPTSTDAYEHDDDANIKE
jgi:hypothetical protein